MTSANPHRNEPPAHGSKAGEGRRLRHMYRQLRRLLRLNVPPDAAAEAVLEEEAERRRRTEPRKG